ncbi:MAG: hypothetical protein ACYDFT_07665, partial [Thermoplasmata archaeon]
LYLALFAVRLLLDLLILGINPFGGATLPATLTPATLAVVVGVDTLYAVSTGLVVGRSVGVYRAFQRKKAAAPLPSSALSVDTSRGP